MTASRLLSMFSAILLLTACTAQASASPTARASVTVHATVRASVTVRMTARATSSTTPSAARGGTATASATPTRTAGTAATARTTVTAASTARGTASASASATRKGTPGTPATPARTATRTPTRSPSATPTHGPSPTPTRSPSPSPTALPPLSLPAGLTALLFVQQGDVWLWDGHDRERVTTGGQVARVPPPQLAPDGTRALILRTTGEPQAPYPQQNAAILTVLTGGQRMLDLDALPAARGRWPIVVWTAWLPGGQALLLRTSSADADSAPAVADEADDYWLADAATGELTLLADLDDTAGTGTTPTGAPQLSPDGRYVALPALDAVLLVEVESGAVTPLLTFEAIGGATRVFPSVSWSVDSRTLFAMTIGEQRTVGVFWEIDVATGGIAELGRITLSEIDAEANAPRWSPDGQWVAWANPEGLVFLAPGRQPTQAQRWSTRSISELRAWSSDSRALAAVAADRRLLVLLAANPAGPPALDYPPPPGLLSWQTAWWRDALIGTGRYTSSSQIVVYRAGAPSAGPGPALQWGLVPAVGP